MGPRVRLVTVVKKRTFATDRESNIDSSGVIVTLLRFFKFINAVGIATGYGLNNQGVGVRVPVGARIFTCPCRLDRLWGPPSLLSNGYRG
jgi:hypothetical protein